MIGVRGGSQRIWCWSQRIWYSCDFSVTPSPNWTFGFGTSFGLGLELGLGGLDLGLGLDKNQRKNFSALSD